jgi:uncharacterized membrane protein HdeD (DUF308 family)
MTEGSDPGTGRSLDGTGSDRSPAAQEAVGIAVRLWWVSVLRGCLALTLGVGALISGASQSVLVNYIALYWLLGGLLTTRWALAVRWKAGARIGLAAGLLAIGTGLILLVRSALVDVVDPAALIGVDALTTMATGGLRLVGAFKVEEQTGHRWTMGGIILGSVEVLLGIILFIVRDAHASTVRITIGVWALVAGTLLLLQGIRMLGIRRASRMSTRI